MKDGAKQEDQGEGAADVDMEDMENDNEEGDARAGTSQGDDVDLSERVPIICNDPSLDLTELEKQVSKLTAQIDWRVRDIMVFL